jgi:transposase
MFAVDLAKGVFQVCEAGQLGGPKGTRQLRRSQVEPFFRKQPPSIIGMEACGSAHYWARLLTAMGHTVRLLPAQYVKPYVRRNKTDARDAEAILEAMQRPTMRLVPIKTVDQQAARGLHRARDLLVGQRTRLGNALRGMLYEIGVIAAQGAAGLKALVALVEAQDSRIPQALLKALKPLTQQWLATRDAIRALDDELIAQAKADPAARRLMTIPGVGPVTAHAVVAAVGDGRQFASARDFAAWVGLTPKQCSTGGKQRSGGISRAGDGGLRRLLALGAASWLRHARAKPEKAGKWLNGILARRPVKVATIAQAAKTARIIWAVLTSGQSYRAQAVA